MHPQALFVALAACLLLIAIGPLAPSANAGYYDVLGCEAAPSHDDNGWTPSGSGGSASDTCSTSWPLSPWATSVKVSGMLTAPGTRTKRFTAPAGTTVYQYTAKQRTVRSAGTYHASEGGMRAIPSGTNWRWCAWGTGICDVGSTTTVATWTLPASSTAVELYARNATLCNHDSNACNKDLIVTHRYVKVRLLDATLPTVTGASGDPLTDPVNWRRGTNSVTFDAADATNIRYTMLRVDGVIVSTTWNTCYSGGTRNDSLYEYAIPCTTDVTGRAYSVDTSSYSTGPHTVVVEAGDSTDISANVRSVSTSVNWDNTAPVPPASVSDSAGADVDWQTSANSLSANWPAGSDAHSGVDDYNYCFSTATSCGGTVIASGNTAATTITRSGLTLTNGTLYYACVRTRDNAMDSTGATGNLSPYRCSDGVRPDTTAPSLPNAVRDGSAADMDWQASTSTIVGNWDVATDSGSGLSRYDYCVATGAGCTGTVVATWTSTALTASVTRSGLALSDGVTYFLTVRAFDAVGNASTVRSSDGIAVDATGPTSPASVADGTGADIDYQSSLTSLSANWPAASDGQSGILDYRYCFSTSATGADCAGAAVVAWTVTAVRTATRNSLTLVDATTYFACVQARNGAQTWSSTRCSDGVTTDSSIPVPPFVYDGDGAADADWQSSTTRLSGSWGDALGNGTYRACYTADPAGADCAAGALVTWTSTTAQSGQATGLTLADGSTWHLCVQAQNLAAVWGPTTCSNGITVDATGPTAVGWTIDGTTGTDLVWQSSTTTLGSEWDTSASDPQSGIDHWQVCYSTNMLGADCAGGATSPWHDVAYTSSQESTGSLTLPHATTYFVCVRAVSGAMSTGPSACSDGVTIDAAAPVAPAVTRDGPTPLVDIDLQGVDGSLSGSWDATADPHSGLDEYQACFTTSMVAADCATTAESPWTSTGLTLDGSMLAAPPLSTGVTYFTCVRAIDLVGNVGAATCSDGIVVELLDVTAVVPGAITQGNRDVSLRIDGAGFQPGAAVTVEGADVTVTSSMVFSSSRIDIVVDVTSSGIAELRDVAVTNPDTITDTLVDGLELLAPSVAVSVTGRSFDDPGSGVVGFGTLLSGDTRSVGPAASGQSIPGAAIVVDVTSTMETSVQVDGGDLIHGGGGTDIPASALSWRLHGTIDPWTAVTTTGVATAPDLEPGTPSVELDMRMDVPPGADAGSYSSVLHISVVAVV